MASTYGNASTATKYLLKFNGSTVGDFVVDFTTSFKRKTPISQRQNFWSSEVILDGSYPAQVWEHEFQLYTEKADRQALAQWFFALETQVSTVAQSLIIEDADTGGAFINFGNCFLTGAEVAEPSRLNRFKAGLFDLKFMGNSQPS